MNDMTIPKYLHKLKNRSNMKWKTIIEIHKVQRRIYARKRIFSEQKDRR